MASRQEWAWARSVILTRACSGYNTTSTAETSGSRINKVHKDENLADIGTKAVSVTVQETLMKLMNFREATGRHPKALNVAGEAVGPEAGSTALADEHD